MSKSDPDADSCIFISDSADVLREKVKKSVTDSIRQVQYDPVNRPGKRIEDIVSSLGKLINFFFLTYYIR
jgi:tryptophanyl-tRNA synthetase